MIASEFDYFAGGGLKKTTGDEGDKTDLYQLAQEAGYKVLKTERSRSSDCRRRKDYCDVMRLWQTMML